MYLQNAKDVVRQISRKHRVIPPIDSQHVKESKGMVKSG